MISIDTALPLPYKIVRVKKISKNFKYKCIEKKLLNHNMYFAGGLVLSDLITVPT